MAGRSPSGFDPSRMSDPWRQMVAEACADARAQAYEGQWIIDGQRADLLGSQAKQLVADTTGLSVTVAGASDYHEGKTFAPAIATETRRAETENTGSVEDEGAGRKASPKGGQHE